MKRIDLLLFMATLAAAAGCGGGDTAANGAGPGTTDGGQTGGNRDASQCTALSPPGAILAWNDNGTPECATAITATRMTSTGQDFLEIVGGTSTGIPIGLTVVSYTSGLDGVYDCKSDAGLGSQYVDFVYVGTMVNCTITIVSPGVPGSTHAVGTFSAEFNATGGGTTIVSNGTFDTPVSP